MIIVNANRCQRWRYKRAECSLCLEACHVESCIREDDGTIQIDDKLCDGCGICTTVCPSGAINLRSLSDKELFERIRNEAIKERIVIGCSINPAASPMDGHQSVIYIKLPCIAILKESHLTALVMSGIKDITLDVSRCNDCSLKHGLNVIGKSVSYSLNLLSAVGYDAKIRLSESRYDSDKNTLTLPDGKKDRSLWVKEIKATPECSRRELFSILIGRSCEKSPEDIDVVPVRRSLLLDAFKGINLNRDEIEIYDGDFPARSLRINEDCKVCYSCELFCPAGALKRIETDGDVRIDFQISLCMGCYQCRELCPHGAIDYHDVIDLKALLGNEVRTIMRRNKKDCQECGRTYFPEAGQRGCPTCAKRKGVDESIFAILTGEQEINK